ncbi:hypothetical protein GGH13_004395 [Coemansia sp. S155-1]|nr:hypothetical protein GGH13_004395 [Coemansia sp. S155-1]
MAAMAGRVSVDGGNMQFGGVDSDTSIALYPPQSTPTMLGWDDMASQSFPGVLSGAHHSDMLLQLAQPSPTLSHYNLSAQATPAFEAYSTPILHHHQLNHAAPSPFMPSSAMQTDQQFPMSVAVNPNIEADVSSSSAMAAYFGAPPHRANNSAGSLASQETLTNSVGVAKTASGDGQLSLAKACMYTASTQAHLMDVEFPATSC